MFCRAKGWAALGALLLNVAPIPSAYGHPFAGNSDDLVLPRASTTPSDYSVIANFAAVGDSYAAGIGAGNALSAEKNDRSCSRYDSAYPILMNSLFNEETDDGRRNFQFLACTGAETPEVTGQIESLRTDSQDLVTVSAGGNDVGFANVLQHCIFINYGDSRCTDALNEAEKKINENLVDNVIKMLEVLDTRMREGGIVVYTLYARFFNRATDVCDDKTWNMLNVLYPNSGPFLTKEKRGRMNDLVGRTNQQLQAAIDKFQDGTKSRDAKYVVVSYDSMIGALGGRFCEDTGSQDPQYVPEEREMFIRNGPPGYVPDQKQLVQPSNASTARYAPQHEHAELGFVNGRHEARSWLPDEITRNFHPNPRGQSVIAMAAISAWEEQRAADLGWEDEYMPDTCPFGADPGKVRVCSGFSASMPWNGEPYVSRDAISQVAESFCDMAPAGIYAEPFNQGQGDSLEILVNYTAGASIPKDECLKSLYDVVDGCDVPDMQASPPFNPLNFKYGGTSPLSDGRGYIGFRPLNKWHESFNCRPLDSPRYINMRNAYDFIQQVCSQAPRGPEFANFTLAGYNADANTADHVEFNIVIPAGFIFTEDQCNAEFFRLIDGCNYDSTANPMNMKMGGTLDVDGIHLEVNPQHDRHVPLPTAPGGDCRSRYKVFYADFNVNGWSFATSDNGMSHAGLWEQIRGCGLITAWDFWYLDTPNQFGHEFSAKGNLPIGTRGCVSRAMRSAGGPDVGCSGSG